MKNTLQRSQFSSEVSIRSNLGLHDLQPITTLQPQCWIVSANHRCQAPLLAGLHHLVASVGCTALHCALNCTELQYSAVQYTIMYAALHLAEQHYSSVQYITDIYPRHGNVQTNKIWNHNFIQQTFAYKKRLQKRKLAGAGWLQGIFQVQSPKEILGSSTACPRKTFSFLF